MAVLQNKIDFALVIAVNHANPNGDPLNGNRPRETYEGLGEISDVCLKRKIRNRMMDLGQNVFVQSDDRCNDGFKSLKDRADGCPAVKKAEKDKVLMQRLPVKPGWMCAALARCLPLRGKNPRAMVFPLACAARYLFIRLSAWTRLMSMISRSQRA